MTAKFEITKEIAVLSRKGRRSLRLNIMRWNDHPETFDLRLWLDSAPEGLLPSGKGIMMDEWEASCLLYALQSFFAESTLATDTKPTAEAIPE